MTDLPAESVAVATINGEAYYSHYFSTYCIHGLHDDCRLTCKHCARACCCDCHQGEHTDGDA